MGEMVEMMLDGILCGICGEFLDEQETDNPRYCQGCSEEVDQWQA